ncbi:dTMP kinase [Umezawaea tangerina]|uniref:Thymidylate kinase n=1 Tax=Umezawaea tangerina TaxID=84725 RepID=A0A2T0TDX2_9PSEU|nr:dTMP kinase [Umezawaea tangerina]PRY43866.1 thymidylate kinase [Umezawaea tangerina]
MGKLVVIEGLDGSGKRTLAGVLTRQLVERGARVTSRAFPRYGESVHADLVREALHGRLGDLTDSVYAMAVLYALDRQGAATAIRADLATHDVVLLDRYVASNAAYGAARLHEDAGGRFVEWVRALEADRFGLPSPDLQLLLRVPTAVAADRAARREQTEADRARDLYEADRDLQQRCAEVYDGLATSGWLGPWEVLDDTSDVKISALLDRLFCR